MHLRKMNKNKVIPFQPWTGHSSVVGHLTHPHSHTHRRGHCRRPVHVPCPSLGWGGTSVPRETPPDIGRTCEVHWDSSPAGNRVFTFIHDRRNRVNETVLEDSYVSLQLCSHSASAFLTLTDQGLPCVWCGSEIPKESIQPLHSV